jgi:lipopolysaccharide transport system ATP-binding protein
MSEAIISVENLGKRYSIRHQQGDRYSTLRDALSDKAKRLFRRPSNVLSDNGSPAPAAREDFWAVKDVSFEVKPGEVLGIIGRNGAGKSTLLKILSRITEPTEGRVRIRGRVASLLEVGTGFHPELSGRENIFLNGAVLGMTRKEIINKFDEIVAFAETEKFLDTPVKHYSSGMYVRLAFAVAAHLEPEILVVDEVLAVGDAEFQKKCLGKMDEVAHQQGRTVLFVSHNMATINRLCQRCLLLESGMLKANGEAYTVTGLYMVSDTGTIAERHWEPQQSPGDDVARLESVRVLQDGVVAETVDIRRSVEIEMTFRNLLDGARLLAGFSFFDSQNTPLFVTADFGEHEWSVPRMRGTYRAKCSVPGNIFAEGIVRIVAEISTRHPVYQIHFLAFDSVAFQVVDTGATGSVRAGWGRPLPGVMRPLCQWRTEVVEEKANPH